VDLDLTVFFVLVGIVAFVVAYVVATILPEKRRRALAAWASLHNLTFDRSQHKHFDEQYSHFACLRWGHLRFADSVMQGRFAGHEVCAFDYHNSSGDSKRGNFSAVVVTTDWPLKPLMIRPANVDPRMVVTAGLERIQFESAEFSRQFHVGSSDRRWAFDVLPQATLEFLMNSPKFVLEFRLCHIIAYRFELFQPTDFESAIHVIEGVLQRLPISLVRELNEQSTV
jgi:hypothetical protein